ncbi:MAG: methionyl-tRNA formyltransferase [Epulopiscium sp.]|nr:methionyl-tRNA formyltransferase [Candidatus Epulonipiscium sp.]
MNIVFMGTPEFAVPCLKMLIDSNHQVKAVFTQPDRPKGRGKQLAAPPVKIVAQKYEIPVFQPLKIKEEKFVQQLRNIEPDVIVVVAYGQILSKEILEIPPYGCINVHASLLPKYRGAAPIQWAIINGEECTGITTMYMNTGLDTGDMILRREVPISFDDTAGSLHDILSHVGAKVLKDTLICIETGKVPRQKQNDEEATYAPILKKSVGLISWNQPALKIRNQIRGLSPWPSAYTYYRENMLKIWAAQVDTRSDDICKETPGQIIDITEQGVVIQTGLGKLLLQEVQLQGKRRMTIQEFLRGNPMKKGEILGENGSRSTK